ncbi:FMN-binding glutamate synthase family protein [Sulfurovum mangrovi]|uniref:FMN-binding glutamate synthase family protein n=1 Tax=Sulfurovum mangrovi TaxID=2893889 RepID=UPI001E558234|nr:FMN-binding glutamate synthase family protein [Sulfurovum mangrovi]UFH58064.1 FMN-binding glutamate synthase family protein [Sulfurovum mangrovi]
MRKQFVYYSLFTLSLLFILSFFYPFFLWLLLLTSVLVGIGIYDMYQTKHSLRRNYPLIGRARWMLEAMRPPIRQYFIESDIDGVPINRMLRGLVYRRAKKEVNTLPFGTKMDTYEPGYEWIGHSLKALDAAALPDDFRIRIGSSQCKQPYDSSLLNISAMSFGALSQNAILALGYGAKLGHFAHNTGEGGLSPYHLQTGADLIWQIGTGYFSCRDEDGHFSPELFAEKAKYPQVKMIEIKLSQGAKPGHGGILPADKNSEEIAAIRGVEAHTRVDSPPTHSTFSTPLELLAFVQQLRDLSEGKPVGFKLAIGQKNEFIAICKAMIETGICPDFITVDGGEGGTGAAPLEHTNSVGMPLREALAFVSDVLTGYDLKKEIKIIVSGKMITGMDIVKALALGADLCASARSFMLSLGCIQALQCHKNTCPSGIATQDKSLSKGVVVTDKKQRVANYHSETLHSFKELLASAGLSHPDQLSRVHIYQRVDRTEYHRYDEFFPPLAPGELLAPPYPPKLERYIVQSSPNHF